MSQENEKLNQIEIEKEIRRSEAEGGNANFKRKTLSSFSLFQKKVKVGLLSKVI